MVETPRPSRRSRGPDAEGEGLAKALPFERAHSPNRNRTPSALLRVAKIDLSLVPSAMEQLAASWKKESAR